MRTIIIIVSVVIIILGAMPQKVHAQVRATATVTATVIPSISLEIRKSSVTIRKEEANSLTMNLRGTGNILVVVDSKEVKSINVLQLTTEKSTMVKIPSSPQAGKTSITYLSS
jgi:hypothetical protein